MITTETATTNLVARRTLHELLRQHFAANWSFDTLIAETLEQMVIGVAIEVAQTEVRVVGAITDRPETVLWPVSEHYYADHVGEAVIDYMGEAIANQCSSELALWVADTIEHGGDEDLINEHVLVGLLAVYIGVINAIAEDTEHDPVKVHNAATEISLMRLLSESVYREALGI